MEMEVRAPDAEIFQPDRVVHELDELRSVWVRRYSFGLRILQVQAAGAMDPPQHREKVATVEKREESRAVEEC